MPYPLNPDFILETKSGISVAIEYKGEHLADKEYKEKIGSIWGCLNEKYKFIMATVKNIDEAIKKVKGF